MTGSPFHTLSLGDALLFGPTMGVFYLLLVTWFTLFGIHLAKPPYRHHIIKILLPLTMVIFALGPLKLALLMFVASQEYFFTGQVNAHTLMEEVYLHSMGVFVIIGACIVLLGLFSWAWLLTTPIEKVAAHLGRPS